MFYNIFLFNTEYFKTPFFIICMVSLFVLIMLLILLEVYYHKRNINVKSEEVTNEDPIIDDLEIPLLEENKKSFEEMITINEEENEIEEDVEQERIYIPPVLTEDVTTNTDIVIRYKKSFLAKLILNKDLQSIYQELRDYIMSFKKVKSRLSFKYERFSIGRKVLIKMLVRGKRLYLYFALNPNDQLPKYHIVDVSDKKIGEQLPSLLKVLSPRSVKYAKELIDILMNENEIVPLPVEKFISIDYKDLLRRRSLTRLIEEGLVVEYKVNANSFNFSQNGDFLTEEEIIAITPEKADELVEDSVLDEVIETKIEHRYGKIEVVNIDDLSLHFNEGDYINLELLKKSHLVSKNACRIKVLARGTLDKKITVEADAFSKQAMKMIVYKGGKVIVIK